MSAEPSEPDVYAEAAPIYWAAGWRGVLPLPPGRKYPPPDGFTGARGLTPSYADVSEWAAMHPGGNVGLRLPADALGVDVDSYGGKPGALVLGHLEQRLGALPPTHRSTARADGHSGILFYRVPPGLRWPSVLGPGIEVIRAEHRYAVVWPSRHPGDDTTPTGDLYRWYDRAGRVMPGGMVPDPAELPELPEAWVMHFTGGELAREQQHGDLAHAEVAGWLEAHGQGEPCRRMTHALRAVAELTTGTSRHDAALTLTNRLCWLAGEGHPGLGEALQTVRAAFLAAMGTDREGAVADEFVRMVTGAVDLSAGAHPDPPSVDPCADPLAGVLAHASGPDGDVLGRAERADPLAPVSGPVSAEQHPPAPAPAPGPLHALEAGTADEPSEPDEPDEPARSTWLPVDLRAAMDGEDVPPCGLVRLDGAAIFYRGALNSVIGPSESGKTWVALVTLVQRVLAGEPGVIVDFEDSARGTVGRLRALGLSDDVILERIYYIRPEAALTHAGAAELRAFLESLGLCIAVIDGINAAMSLQGMDLMDNKDATSFHQAILRKFEHPDIITVTVDHTPKTRGDESAGGIGAQAKRAMMTGCVVRAEPVTVFGRGQRGVIRLWVDKDRPGFVREISERKDRASGAAAHWVADVTLDPLDGGGIRAAVLAPEQVALGGIVPTAERELEARLLLTIGASPGVTWTEALRGTQGNDRALAEALERLVQARRVRVDRAPGPRSARRLFTWTEGDRGEAI